MLGRGYKKVFGRFYADRSPPKFTQKLPKWTFFERMVGGGMARPREPVDLIAAKGRKHLTKEEYKERKNTEVTAPADNVSPPAFLSKKERKKFEEIARQLIELKIMSNLDCDVLARYVEAETEYIKVTKQIQKIKFLSDKKSMITEDEQLSEQYARYNFLSKIQHRLMKACNENARELGLTISSRCRLVIPKEKEEKPINKFMKHA